MNGMSTFIQQLSHQIISHELKQAIFDNWLFTVSDVASEMHVSGRLGGLPETQISVPVARFFFPILVTVTYYTRDKGH